VIGRVLFPRLGQLANDLVARGAGELPDLREIRLAGVDPLGDDRAFVRDGCGTP